MNQLIQTIEHRFSKSNLSGRIILPQVILPGPEYLSSPEFLATNHLPFFYLAGDTLGSCKTVLCVNPNYGLELASFLKGAQATNVLGFGRTQMTYPFKNVRTVGRTLEICESLPEVEIDVALILGEQTWPDSRDLILDVSRRMSEDSLIIVDYINSESVGRGWKDFEMTTNTQGVVFSTRHGTGIIMR